LDLFRNDSELADVSTSLENLILTGNYNDETVKQLNLILIQLHKSAGRLAAHALKHSSEITGSNDRKECNKILEQSTTQIIDAIALTLSGKSISISEELHEIRNILDQGEVKDVWLWDPYVIAAISDLVEFSRTLREKANFLHRLKKKIPPSMLVSDPPLPGVVNYFYYLADAKMRSSASWPFDEVVQEIKQAIDLTNAILASKQIFRLDEPDFDNQASALNVRYRRNRLIVLSAGLELMYNRSLSGEEISAPNLWQWEQWLAETRAAFAIVQGRKTGAPSLRIDEAKRWLAASESIRSDPDLISDVTTSVALSIALTGLRHGRQLPAADCDEASSLAKIADSDEIIRRYEQNYGQREDDVSRIKGWVEQVKSRVADACGH
jgi:hypothetical protein